MAGVGRRETGLEGGEAGAVLGVDVFPQLGDAVGREVGAEVEAVLVGAGVDDGEEEFLLGQRIKVSFVVYFVLDYLRDDGVSLGDSVVQGFGVSVIIVIWGE